MSGPDTTGVLGAQLFGVVEPRLFQVHGDDLRAGDRGQDLHGHVSESTHTDDDCARSRRQVRTGNVDRVIRGQRRIRQRGRVDRVEVTQRHEEPRLGDDILGHAAVEAETRAGNDFPLVHLAVVFVPGRACATASTPPTQV